MKLRNKLILDLCLFITIWFVMSYHFTGGLIHEILGLALIIGFIVHIVLNRKYYFSMTTKILNAGELDKKGSVSYVLNAIMLLSVVVMLISSIAISKDIFPSVSKVIGNYAVWRTIHISAAVLILVCMLVHILLHASLFNSLIKNHINSNYTNAMRVISGALALLIVVGAIKISFSSIMAIGSSGMKDYSENYVQIRKKDEDTSQITESIQQDNSDTEQASLDDYLKGLFCNGCGRHCSLLSPQCGKGERKAEQATTEYYSTYSSEN